MKGLKLNTTDLVFKPIGLGLGMFAGEKLSNVISSLDPGTMDFLKDSPALVGFGKIVLGAMLPGLAGGRSKSGTLNKLIPSIGDGLVASGSRDLMIEYKVITGVNGLGGDFLYLDSYKKEQSSLSGLQA